jgi:hypothetical protein
LTLGDGAMVKSTLWTATRVARTEPVSIQFEPVFGAARRDAELISGRLLTAAQKRTLPDVRVGVTPGNAHGEQMFSASPPEADVATDIR